MLVETVLPGSPSELAKPEYQLLMERVTELGLTAEKYNTTLGNCGGDQSMISDN